MSEKTKYPCENCKDDAVCQRYRRHKKCEPFKKWFREQWREIRRLFGVECVDSTHEEGDLNE